MSMKKLFFFTVSFFSLFLSQAQSFNSPESVDFDAVRGRWIVAQNGSGEIHVYQPQSNALSVLATGITSGPHGIECVGDTVFCCDGSRIRGYNLLTGASVFNLNLGATFLNGLTYDGNGNLYATDFSGKKIFRVQINGAVFSQLATTAYQPNGIYYDGAQNRCVFVNWGTNARIQAIDLSTNAISDLYVSTLSNIDGITRDAAGRWYITTWGGNALRRFDPDFSAAPVTVLNGLSSPADIDINTAGDSIGIPNSGTANNVVFYAVPQVVSASCSANDSVICSGNSVTFSAQAIGNANSWNWSFPGGTPSTASTSSAIVTYPTAGVYDVSLIASNSSGSSDTVTLSSWITVVNPPDQPSITQNGNTLEIVTAAPAIQWILAGQDISGANASTFQPDQSGSYQVRVSDSEGCTSLSAPFDYVLTSLPSMISSSGLTLYPIPAKDAVSVSLHSDNEPFTIRVMDMQGRECVRAVNCQGTYVLGRADMSSGVYVIQVISETQTISSRFQWE